MGLLDDKTVNFKCAKCGHEIRESIGFLKSQDSMVCAGCGVTINLDTKELARGAEEAQKAIDRLKDSFRR